MEQYPKLVKAARIIDIDEAIRRRRREIENNKKIAQWKKQFSAEPHHGSTLKKVQAGAAIAGSIAALAGLVGMGIRAFKNRKKDKRENVLSKLAREMKPNNGPQVHHKHKHHTTHIMHKR